MIGCIKPLDSFSNENTLSVDMSNNDIYEYRTGISGDEERTSIIVQARHFEISDIFRNAGTQYEAVYKYKPEAEFSGRDYVEIETRRGSDGASPSNKVAIIKIKIQVY